MRYAIAASLIACGCRGEYWLGGRRSERDTSGPRAADAASPDDAGRVDERTLTADVVLSGDDDFRLEPAAAGCFLRGNGHTIRSEGKWTGSLTIRGCTIRALGGASTPALALQLSGSGRVTLEGNTWSASGAIAIANEDDSSTTFRDNTILDDSLVALDPSFDRSTPAFKATGASAAAKVFAGNRVERSLCWFASPNWLIGGDGDADGNLVVGLRAGIVLASSGIVVRGNYVHNLRYPEAGDESALSVIYGTSDALVEHNVLRGGTWVIRGFGGELRYNAILDAGGDDWLNQPFEDTKVHHNLFAQCEPPDDAAPSGLPFGIHLVNFRAGGIEIWNNTLDGGGPDMGITGAAVAIDEDCTLASLRSNVIFDFPYWRNDGGAAAVRPGVLESVEPPPQRIDYADYNLFWNPDAEGIRNYAVAVGDRAARRDAGFGLHDAHAGGPLDEQVDPRLASPSGECFPWSDEDILSRKASVSQLLAGLRAAYSPMPGSPVLGAGDPADGPDTPIGCVGDGSDVNDRFGSF